MAQESLQNFGTLPLSRQLHGRDTNRSENVPDAIGQPLFKRSATLDGTSTHDRRYLDGGYETLLLDYFVVPQLVVLLPQLLDDILQHYVAHYRLKASPVMMHLLKGLCDVGLDGSDILAVVLQGLSPFLILLVDHLFTSLSGFESDLVALAVVPLPVSV